MVEATFNHQDAILRRRIKFVVEKGAMARLFKKHQNARLQAELARRLEPAHIARIQTREEYDNWHSDLLENNCWAPFSKGGLDQDRWAYFAKLINIVVYEVATNLEIFNKEDWERIRAFLHVPLDSRVSKFVRSIDDSFPKLKTLKGMTKAEYHRMQDLVRNIAERQGKPAIWFETAWSPAF